MMKLFKLSRICILTPFPPNVDFKTSGAGWKQYEDGFVRIAAGKGSGQVAKISNVSEQQTGPYKGKIVLGISTIYHTGSTALQNSARYLPPASNTNTLPAFPWFVPPAANDFFVLIRAADMLWWLNFDGINLGEFKRSLPAAITVGEVVSDAAFVNYNMTIKRKIDDSLKMMPKSFKRKSVPTLFHEHGANAAQAFVPNAVNSQQIDGNTYFPKQYGPRDAGNLDVFSTAFQKIVSNSSEIDDWYDFHLLYGEIHCGSNVDRTPSVEWWKKIPTP
jgi:hypothetical protein